MFRPAATRQPSTLYTGRILLSGKLDYRKRRISREGDEIKKSSRGGKRERERESVELNLVSRASQTSHTFTSLPLHCGLIFFRILMRSSLLNACNVWCTIFSIQGGYTYSREINFRGETVKEKNNYVIVNIYVEDTQIFFRSSFIRIINRFRIQNMRIVL